MGRMGVCIISFIFVLGLLLTSCSSSDNPDATGSHECCVLRKLCDNCNCSDAEQKTGLEDKKNACVVTLGDGWGEGCGAYSRTSAESACN